MLLALLAWRTLDSWAAFSAGSQNAKYMLGAGNRPDGRMYLLLTRGADSGGGTWHQAVADLPEGRWVHLEAYYRKAADQTGQVIVWQDGAQLLDVAGVRTANDDDLQWAVTNYGQDTAPADVTVYVDDAAIGTSRLGPR